VPGELGQQFLEQRPLRFGLQAGGQVGLQFLCIGKGIGFRVFLDEEIERIDHDQIGKQIDGNLEMIDRIGKRSAPASCRKDPVAS
jgi:hypothetical protein